MSDIHISPQTNLRNDTEHSYSWWNRLLTQHFFQEKQAGRSVYLTISPSLLERLYRLHTQNEIPQGEERGYRSFLRAMRARISEKGWDTNQSFPPEPPEGLALACLQILAAFHMKADEKKSARAYWIRLKEILEDPKKGYMTVGLNPVIHQNLWQNLEHWLNSQKGRVGKLPPVCRGHKHIARPLTHTFLRETDLEAIPTFLDKHKINLENRQRAFRQIDSTLIIISKRSHNLFSKHLQQILKHNQLRSIVVKQILDFGIEWATSHPSGTCQDLVPRKQAKFRHSIWLRFFRYGQWFFDAGPSGKNEGETGWKNLNIYLEQAFEPCHRDCAFLILPWSANTGRFISRSYAYPDSLVLVLVPSAYLMGWLSLPPNAQLIHIFGSGINQIELQGWPRRWSGLVVQLPPTLESLPTNWRQVLRYRKAFSCKGGLRLEPGVWMQGAGPRICQKPIGIGAQLTIDGHIFSSNQLETGRLPIWQETGCHYVEHLGHRQEVRIRTTQITPSNETLIGWSFREGAWPEPNTVGQVPNPSAIHGGRYPQAKPLTNSGPITNHPTPQNTDSMHWIQKALLLRGKKSCLLMSPLGTPISPLLSWLDQIGSRRFLPMKKELR
ncbi:hypothetical protein SCOR_28930 [Sulfidibacter corallicola]|uniref:Uncharacterized protein n=1 Tax=Sulfidibacter corallicola TaxID=2818388 RepID=A0A8A4TNA8_SULCO|nr:hypothetical protein [Sulfidibacter corallicola]QTD50418.1 hypothetical protein J3U87_32950 [Sulfidibacter corallicola]